MLEQKVFEFIKKYNLISNHDKIVCGVSGGPDSITMLNVLYELNNSKKIEIDLCVAHINHGLRENAKIEEKYVQDFCKDRNIDFYVKHANIREISQNENIGIEEAGRKIRYEFFEEILNKTGSNKIAVAHNKNDNAETIVMNLLRGSGISGLSGIKKCNGKIVRPLIEIERSEIEKYLSDRNILSMHDESNDENIYTRNKIRNLVFPYIKQEFNPNIVASLNRLSEIAQEEENYFDKIVGEKYKEILIEEINVSNDYNLNRIHHAEITIDLKKFNLLDKLIQKKIILYSIKKIFGSTRGIEKIHVDDIIKLCNNNIGNKYLTPNKNVKIVIKKKQLNIIAI